jgi:hypothetical protein
MKSIFAARRPRPEPHPLEATTVWKEYQKAKQYQQSKSASARRKKIGFMPLAALAVAGIGVAIVLVAGRPREQMLPPDAKARSEFVDAQSSNLGEEQRRVLARFLARLEAQEAAGVAVPKLTVADAIERQRAYDKEVGEVQKRIQSGLDAAKSAMAVNVREQELVKSDAGKSTSGKSLRYVLEIVNRDKRTVDAMGVRVEFRDPSRKYVAAIPTLELKGPLTTGEKGRSVQMIPLDATTHKYIVDGGVVQISAYPTQIAYGDGEKIDAEKELKLLESLARAKIE